MKKQLTLKLLPSEAADSIIISNLIVQSTGFSRDSVMGYHILKRSIDARSRQPWINLTVLAFINEPVLSEERFVLRVKDVSHSSKKVLIVGTGPAGLFAALKLLEKGIKPILLERGKNVRSRRRDLARLNKEGLMDPESNYCFGEGGAGTYSDGKLYTRSTKRGDVQRILQLFHYFGAGEEILYEAHPHIGTNKLPAIITAIREKIIECGGEIHFETKVTDLVIYNNIIKGVIAAGNTYEAGAVILATGHSARDIFNLLNRKKIFIEAKPFALGVRVEHPQNIIDNIQYHCSTRDQFLPPASYNLVHRVNNKGVFSFCMCPGGIIAPAATDNGEVVVNGWSPSKRNNPFANSGIVAEVQKEDLVELKDFEEITGTEKDLLLSPLGMMYFQQYVERKAFLAGGGKFTAPAQRLVDFCENKLSSSLPDCSYIPGVQSCFLKNVLPPAIHHMLKSGFKEFGKKMKGYYSNDAVVVATESRTSSPVRIPRNGETLEHPQINNLYPCGEGAGYAGGIVSAAMDGERVASIIGEKQGQ
ncbi:MAG: FAD-binding protein [Bacteroidia bacterium]|nr:FAD-binding protein [Bacteroidia bacterium]